MKDRIEINPKIMLGKPVIKGTRITVEHILKLLKQGLGIKEILKDYPRLKKTDIEAAIDYVSESLSKERAYPLTTQ
ncbi:MAG: DUF433 domain-containing protein [Candidatus Levybacteria bacterium]|nr:DUF433 domain-containing protein [Candidatus Levybacteria bacterium]